LCERAAGFLDKGKPSAKVGRKAMGPSGIARLPKGQSTQESAGNRDRFPALAAALSQEMNGVPFLHSWSFFLGLNERKWLMLANLKKKVVNFLKREDGPTAVEYAVMLALIIVVCIAAISALGSNASNTYNYVANKVATTSS
jgi:pilus assembly protein Flp/PilA